jgi:hypothetical protein
VALASAASAFTFTNTQRTSQEVKWHDARDKQLANLDLSGSGSSSEQQQEQPDMQREHQELVGVVLNVAGRGLWSSLTGGRHWLAIACIQGCWCVCACCCCYCCVRPNAMHHATPPPLNRWNLDSQLPAPVRFGQQPGTPAAASDDGGAAALRAFLQQQLAGGAHLLLVHRQQQGTVEQEAEPAAAG